MPEIEITEDDLFSAELRPASPTNPARHPALTKAVDPGSFVSTGKRLLFTGPSPFGGHRYELFDMCPRRYGLEYTHNPLPTFDSSGQLVSTHADQDGEESAWELIRGTMVHTGLAHYYALKRNGPDDQGLYSPEDAMKALHAQERSRAHAYDRVHWDNALLVGLRVLPAYAARYAFDKSRPVVVEEVFTMELGELNAPYTFRLDLGVMDSSGQFWAIDHKTTTTLRRDHGWIYGISTQFQAYAVAGSAVYGQNFGGVQANMIQCPNPESNEDPVFERKTSPNVAGFLAGFGDRISAIYGRMLELVSKGITPDRWPKRPGTRSCKAYGRICPYYDRCSSTAD